MMSANAVDAGQFFETSAPKQVGKRKIYLEPNGGKISRATLSRLLRDSHNTTEVSTENRASLDECVPLASDIPSTAPLTPEPQENSNDSATLDEVSANHPVDAHDDPNKDHVFEDLGEWFEKKPRTVQCSLHSFWPPNPGGCLQDDH
ncbi:unnamed protein product [Ixodes persulcatus]